MESMEDMEGGIMGTSMNTMRAMCMGITTKSTIMNMGIMSIVGMAIMKDMKGSIMGTSVRGMKDIIMTTNVKRGMITTKSTKDTKGGIMGMGMGMGITTIIMGGGFGRFGN